MTQQRSGRRKVRIGRVVSDKMNKTVTIAVDQRTHHPLYGKSVRQTSKLKAHDENNTYRVGDRVRVVETRPLSASKRWRVVELISRAEIPEAYGEVESSRSQQSSAGTAGGSADAGGERRS